MRLHAPGARGQGDVPARAQLQSGYENSTPIGTDPELQFDTKLREDVRLGSAASVGRLVSLTLRFPPALSPAALRWWLYLSL